MRFAKLVVMVAKLIAALRSQTSRVANDRPWVADIDGLKVTIFPKES